MVERHGEPPPQSPLLSVEIIPARQRVVPGDKAIYAITVENRSDEAQAQSLEVTGIPEDWYALEFDEARVAFPREQRTATLIVAVPEEHEPAVHDFDVIVRASGETSSAHCSLEVGAPSRRPAPAGPAVEPEARGIPEARTGLPLAPHVTIDPEHVIWGGDATREQRLVLTVRNVGSTEAEYVVSLHGLRPGWCTLPPKLRVPAGKAVEPQVRFHPPARAKLADYPFRIRVAVDKHPNVAVEAQGRLTIAEREVAPRRPVRPPKETAGEIAPGTPVLPPELSLAPRTTFRFGPGEMSAQAVVTVENKSTLIERYVIQVLGIPEEWYSLATSELRLDSGGSAQVPLRLTPRPGPGHPAGEYSFRVRVAPHRFPDSFAEVGALITIVAVPAFDARLTPMQARGRKEKFKLTLINTGAVPLSLWMEASDPRGMCRFKFPPPPNLAPGEASVVPVWVGARRNGLIGLPETLDFRLRVMPAGAESSAAKSFDARFVHDPFLGSRFVQLSLLAAFLVTVLGVILALGIGRIGDGITWVRCLGDDDYEKAGFVFIKQSCGGLSEPEQQGKAPKPTASPRATASTQLTPTALPPGCTSVGGIKVGGSVSIAANTQVREDAGLDKPRMTTLSREQDATVLEGYKCADLRAWWRVRTDSLEGWVAEWHEEQDGTRTQLINPK